MSHPPPGWPAGPGNPGYPSLGNADPGHPGPGLAVDPQRGAAVRSRRAWPWVLADLVLVLIGVSAAVGAAANIAVASLRSALGFSAGFDWYLVLVPVAALVAVGHGFVSDQYRPGWGRPVDRGYLGPLPQPVDPAGYRLPPDEYQQPWPQQWTPPAQ